MTRNELAWMWAVNENLWLLDAHDAYLIDRVKEGRLDRDDLDRMLKSYGLYRWLPPSLHEPKGKEEIILVCNEVYTKDCRKLITGGWPMIVGMT